MNKKYENAKKQGLNWQALIIEETQTEIKVEIQKMILLQKSYYEINKKVVELIESAINELENEDLKNTAKPTLYVYATRVYNYLKQTYQNLNLLALTALIAVANKTANLGQTRTVNDIAYKLSDSVYNRAIPLDLFAKDYIKMIKERVDYLTKIEAKEDYTSRVNLRNIAEMQIRQERHEHELQYLKDNDVNLVWIVPHANCSERCEHWQGRLYSLNHTYGIIDGYEYEPLENATDIYERTKAGKIYKNGCISGFNCRHTLKPYNNGNKPIEIPGRVINKQREINTKQRYLEKGVREWKERALLYKDIDKKLYNFAKTKAKQWNERYIAYSKENDVAYYPSRTDII